MTLAQLDVTLERPLPQSPDAERAVLGSILIVNAAFYRISGIVTTDDFFKDANRLIHGTMSLMVEERQPIELLLLKEALQRSNLLGAVGGYAYLTSLVDFVPDVANIEKYAQVVADKARRRRLIILGSEMARDALEPEAEKPTDAITAAALTALGKNATREDTQSRRFATVQAEAFEEQRELARLGKTDAMDCGWPTLLSCQVFYPTLVTVSALRSSGKSALMPTWGRALASRGNPTALFTLESREKEITLRDASQFTGIKHGLMRDWRWPAGVADEYLPRIAECQRATTGLPLFINDGPRELEALMLEIRRLRAVHGIKAVFIDYVQQMISRRRFERSDLMYAAIANELRDLANKLGVMICLFSQVNKAGDLAYAEAIENAARVRLHFERPDGGCHIAFEVKKNNEGRRTIFPAHFNELTQRWDEGLCDGLAGDPKMIDDYGHDLLIVQHQRTTTPSLF